MNIRFAILNFAFFASFTAVCPADDKPAEKAPKDARLDRTTPEGTLRVFMIAVIAGNEQLVKMTAMAESEDDLKLIATIKGERPPLKEIREKIAGASIRALKVGDKFTLPNGKQVEVTSKEVDSEHMVLLPEGAPLPFRMIKSNGDWWVDAGPVVAGRKAAAAFQKLVDAETASLEGTWDVVSAECGGKPLPADNSPAKLAFHAGNVILQFAPKSGKDEWKTKVEFDPRGKLKRADFVRAPGERLPCIYELTGESLKFAMPSLQKDRKAGEKIPRPDSFDSKSNDVIVIVAKRQAAPSAIGPAGPK
jgi:uncharacterized protein (TIGR03067 family)